MTKILKRIEDLMQSDAYTNSANPKHEEVTAEVTKYFKENFKDGPNVKKKYKWVCGASDNTCGTCSALNGKLVDNMEDFKVCPPVHPHCGCSIIEVWVEEEEEEDRVDEIKMSDKGKIFLKNKEGDKEYQRENKKSYRDGMFYIHDDGAGYGTIGYGHKITANEKNRGIFKNGITEEEAEKLFKKDVNIAINNYNKYIKRKDYSQNQIDAILSFLYNIGGGDNFINSNTRYLLQNKLDKHPISGKTLEKEFKEWNTSDGEYNDGLNNRRNAEWDLFTTGKYIN